MAKTAAHIPSKNFADIPQPIVNLNHDFVLQHKREQDYFAFLASSFVKSNDSIVDANLSFDVAKWAHHPINVGISLTKDPANDVFFSNKPMIFMEIYSSNDKIHTNRLNGDGGNGWGHPVNIDGALNRVNSNYGGGANVCFAQQKTEWDLTTKDLKDQIIQIIPQDFYRMGFLIESFVPGSWSAFQLGNCHLRFSKRNGIAPFVGEPKVVTNYQQPIRFRFGYIDPRNNRTVVLGVPSNTVYLKPKWGRFEPQNETYIYDWQVCHHNK